MVKSEISRGTFKIYKADVFDIEELSHLWLNMIYEVVPSPNPRVDWWKSYIEEFMKNDLYHCYYAEIDDKVVGFMDAMLYPDPITGKLYAQCMHTYVLPEYRPDATFVLYKKVLNEGRKHKVDAFELNCFDPTKSFWEKHGMKCFGYHMRKDL